MKIVVLSNTPWADTNSFGNTYDSIFSGITGLEFCSIFCKSGMPCNKQSMVVFQITEYSLMRNLRNPRRPSGHKIAVMDTKNSGEFPKKELHFPAVQKLRWQIFFWGRDLIWKIGRWKSPELKAFLDEFQPDLIFQPVYYSSHLNDIAQFIKAYTGVPMVGYISDDCYTLRQFHLSPLYWIDRLWKRQKVKATIEQCELLYVISQIQKEEYEQIFTPPCKILTKCADFSAAPPVWDTEGETLKLLYAGNLGAGRWKSLALVAKAVARLRKEGFSVTLDTYSATPQTAAMQNALQRSGCTLHGPVSYGEVQVLQREADVLLHVEGLSLKSRLAVHQSFSTKLVDYFALGKCIFAVGTADVASIRHLLDNEAAVVAESADTVYIQLKQLLLNRSLLQKYGEKAYLCGRKHHDKFQMQTMLMEDLKRIVETH